MCIFLYIGDSSFLFCFPGYLRLFLCIGFAKIYSIKNTIFLIYLTQIECFAYIYSEYHHFCNVFPIYIQNNTLSFSYALPRICVFSYKCFFFLYIGNRHFFFLGSPSESIPIYSKYLFLIYLAPVFPIYILLYFAQIPYIQLFLYRVVSYIYGIIPFFSLFCPD